MSNPAPTSLDTTVPTTPNATVVLDSISPTGVRVTTIEVTLHRYVLAELNTHRVFSRNSASSRAIPVSKQLDKVRNDPALPVEFGSNQRGMQAGAPLVDDEYDKALAAWLQARDNALASAEQLAELGVHKQVTNRLLEPFMWHTAVITATEWDNFFEQRCSPLAQPEIRLAAEAMFTAREASTPAAVAAGDWHTPYIRPDETDFDVETRKRISTARCARVSYLTHAGVRDTTADEELYQRLVTAQPPHWSPLEHVATPAERGEPTLGNLNGWHQLRHWDK